MLALLRRASLKQIAVCFLWMMVLLGSVTAFIKGGFFGVFLYFGLIGLVVSFTNHMKEQKARRSQLQTYANAGGKPWTNRKFCKNKAEEEAWDQQNEINKTARIIAGFEQPSEEN